MYMLNVFSSVQTVTTRSTTLYTTRSLTKHALITSYSTLAGLTWVNTFTDPYTNLPKDRVPRAALLRNWTTPYGAVSRVTALKLPMIGCRIMSGT